MSVVDALYYSFKNDYSVLTVKFESNICRTLEAQFDYTHMTRIKDVGMGKVHCV